MSNALDDLLADFAAHSIAATPAVNPPESTKVLAAQTAPEVAGKPEPAVELETAPAPTEKPAEVVAAEQAKGKRGRKPAAEKPAAETESTRNEAPATLRGVLNFLQGQLPAGCTLTISGTQ